MIDCFNYSVKHLVYELVSFGRYAETWQTKFLSIYQPRLLNVRFVCLKSTIFSQINFIGKDDMLAWLYLYKANYFSILCNYLIFLMINRRWTASNN
jgi:hypothetical protein